MCEVSGDLLWRNLPLKFYINLICFKISKTVGIIAKLSHYVPRTILLTLYNSLLLPYISFGGQAAQCHLDNLLKLQKRAIRFNYFVDFQSSAIPLFYSSNISQINILFNESIANLIYDVHVKKAPINICELFTYVDEHHSYNTRASTNKNMYCQYSRLNIQYISLFRFGVRLWNSIPQNTRSLSKKYFKKIKLQLLQHFSKNKPTKRLKSWSMLSPDTFVRSFHLM